MAQLQSMHRVAVILIILAKVGGGQGFKSFWKKIVMSDDEDVVMVDNPPQCGKKAGQGNRAQTMDKGEGGKLFHQVKSVKMT